MALTSREGPDADEVGLGEVAARDATGWSPSNRIFRDSSV